MNEETSFEQFFNFIYDYITITNQCLNCLDIDCLRSKIQENVKNLIRESYNVSNKTELENQISLDLKRTFNETVYDIVRSEIPKIVINIIHNTLGHKYSYVYLRKQRDNSDLIPFTLDILANKVQIKDENTICFNNVDKGREFTIYKDGYVSSNYSIYDLSMGNYRLPDCTFATSHNCRESNSFNGSNFINIYYKDRNWGQLDELKEYILSQINVCEFNKVVSYGFPCLVTPQANILFLNSKNSNYVEFRELLEYCILTIIPNLSKEYSLRIEQRSKVDVTLFDYKGNLLKTKYAEKLTSIVKYLVEIYGAIGRWGDITLEIKVNNEAISVIDRANMLGNYQTKYGTIEELNEIAGVRK